MESLSRPLYLLAFRALFVPESPQKIAANDEQLSVGKRVCFTGEAVGHSGEIIGRSDLEALASKVGLHPVRDVTKKGCDILVAADESTMSGKAKKAKEILLYRTQKPTLLNFV